MEKIIVAAIVLVLGVGLCCGGSALAKLGYNTFYSDPTATPTPDPTVQKLREELDKDPAKIDEKLESDESEDATFKGVGDVPGKGTRDIFDINGIRLNCEEIGRDRPTRCFRIGETVYWACNGQLLKECPECPEPTPPTPTPTEVGPTLTPVVPPSATAVPPTGAPPTATQVFPPTATAMPPTGEPPTATRPLPTNAPTPEGTKECECLEVKVQFDYQAKLLPNEFGTIIEDRPGAGFQVHLPGQMDSFQETSWDECQWFVGNMYQLDKDWGNPGQTPVSECVIVYHRGVGTIKINASDGIMFHVDETTAGFTINEGLAQMRDTLLRGGYGCTKEKIKYIELKSFN